jgi:hypothetical protein
VTHPDKANYFKKLPSVLSKKGSYLLYKYQLLLRISSDLEPAEIITGISAPKDGVYAVKFIQFRRGVGIVRGVLHELPLIFALSSDDACNLLI